MTAENILTVILILKDILLIFLVAQMVKNQPLKQETQVRSLGQEDPLGEEMATHSSVLAREIPWTDGQRSLPGYSPWGCKGSKPSSTPLLTGSVKSP